MNEAPSNGESPKVAEMNSEGCLTARKSVILTDCNDPNSGVASRMGTSEDDWTNAAPGSRP